MTPAGERTAHLTRLAARGFERALRRRLEGEDITFGQWTFLRILWEEDGLTQRALARRATLTEPTTHTAIAGLEASGHVRRTAGEADRRRQHVWLTRAGRSLRAKLEPLALEVNDVAVARLTSDEVEVLRRYLICVVENLEDDERLNVRATAGKRALPPTS